MALGTSLQDLSLEQKTQLPRGREGELRAESLNGCTVGVGWGVGGELRASTGVPWTGVFGGGGRQPGSPPGPLSRAPGGGASGGQGQRRRSAGGVSLRESACAGFPHFHPMSILL